jgi:hypothetical protein
MTLTIDSVNTFKTYSDGILTGLLSTFLFNPVDRALFLMVRDKKPIWDRSLWRKPYSGVSKALYGRIVGYGIFFSLYEKYTNFYQKRTIHPLLLASLSTGLTSVALTHNFNVIKMYQWSHQKTGGVIKTTRVMAKEYGYGVFLRGFPQTCLRDSIFCVTLFSLSKLWNPEKNFIKNIAIASFATALSSPVNYLRNRLFFDFNEYPIPLTKIWQELAEGVGSQQRFMQKFSYIMHDRLNIGWGTLRVGLGIAVAQKIYDHLKSTSYLTFPVSKN